MTRTVSMNLFGKPGITVKMLTAGQWMTRHRGRSPAVVERTMSGKWTCRAVGGRSQTASTMCGAVAAFYAGN